MDDDKRSKSEDSSLTSDINDNQNELEQFRLQWQAELALQRHGQKQESSSTQPELQQPTELALQPIATSDTIEQKVILNLGGGGGVYLFYLFIIKRSFIHSFLAH